MTPIPKYFVLVTVFAAGCGGGADRLPIAGTVSLDGQSLASGQISFCPLPDTKGPTAGAPVVDGQYSITQEKGLTVGDFRVEITAVKPNPIKKRTQNVVTGEIEMTEDYVSILPPRYNRNSDLTAKVTAAGPNQFDFDLSSK